MSQMSDLYNYSALAQAAYGDFVIGADPVPSLTTRSVEMTQFQAERFADEWEVVAQYDGTVEEFYYDEFGVHSFSNPTGLSVTCSRTALASRWLPFEGLKPGILLTSMILAQT